MKNFIFCLWLISVLSLYGILAFSLGQRAQPSAGTNIPKDRQVLLRAGETYRLSFSEKLPIFEKRVLRSHDAYHEWLGGYVEILEQSPIMVRFRTLTSEEALRKARSENEKMNANINLDMVRQEYEQGLLPFSLDYFVITRDTMRSEILLMFSVETAQNRQRANQIKVRSKGLEIAPSLSSRKKAKVRFFLLPEGKDKTVYVLPSDRCPAPR